MPSTVRDRIIVFGAIALVAVIALIWILVPRSTTSGDAFDSGFDAGQAARPYVAMAILILAVVALVWFVRRRR